MENTESNVQEKPPRKARSRSGGGSGKRGPRGSRGTKSIDLPASGYFYAEVQKSGSVSKPCGIRLAARSYKAAEAELSAAISSDEELQGDTVVLAYMCRIMRVVRKVSIDLEDIPSPPKKQDGQVDRD